MCGIVGIVSLDKLDKEDLIYFRVMLERCVALGRDATGIFNSKMMYYKQPVTSHKFLEDPTANRLIDKSEGLHYIIGHCRAATRGNPRDNRNNHPLVDSQGRFLLVHNGTIDCPKWDFDPEMTDTYTIVNAISHHLVDDDFPLYMAVNRGQVEITDCDQPYQHSKGTKWGSHYFPMKSSMIVVGNDKELVLSRNDGYTSVLVRKTQKKGTYAFATTNYVLGTHWGLKEVVEIPEETSFVFDFEYEMATDMKIRMK